MINEANAINLSGEELVSSYQPMVPEARIAAFAQWLYQYLNDASRNNSTYAPIKAAAEEYHEHLTTSVADENLYDENISLLKSHLKRDRKPNEQGRYEDRFYSRAVTKFQETLIYPGDLARRKIAKEAFLEAKKNEDNDITAESKDELDRENLAKWMQLEERLSNNQANNTYFDSERYIAANLNFIKSICVDTVTHMLIQDPVLFLQPIDRMPLTVYDYDQHYGKEGNNTFWHMPKLKDKMNAFYRDLKKDIKTSRKDSAPINDFNDDYLKHIVETPAINQAPAGLYSPTIAEIPQAPTHVNRETIQDHEYALRMLMGAVVGMVIAMFTYGEIDGFTKEVPNPHSNEMNNALTTEGIAYFVAMITGVTLLAATLKYNLQQQRTQTSGTALTTVWGLTAGTFTGLFTAKFSSGHIKPEYNASGAQVDYTFTDGGAAYIVLMAVSGIAGLLLARGILHILTLLIGGERQHNNNAPALGENSGDQANSMRRPLLTV